MDFSDYNVNNLNVKTNPSNSKTIDIIEVVNKWKVFEDTFSRGISRLIGNINEFKEEINQNIKITKHELTKNNAVDLKPDPLFGDKSSNLQVISTPSFTDPKNISFKSLEPIKLTNQLTKEISNPFQATTGPAREYDKKLKVEIPNNESVNASLYSDNLIENKSQPQWKNPLDKPVAVFGSFNSINQIKKETSFLPVKENEKDQNVVPGKTGYKGTFKDTLTRIIKRRREDDVSTKGNEYVGFARPYPLSDDTDDERSKGGIPEMQLKPPTTEVNSGIFSSKSDLSWTGIMPNKDLNRNCISEDERYGEQIQRSNFMMNSKRSISSTTLSYNSLNESNSNNNTLQGGYNEASSFPQEYVNPKMCTTANESSIDPTLSFNDVPNVSILNSTLDANPQGQLQKPSKRSRSQSNNRRKSGTKNNKASTSNKVNLQQTQIASPVGLPVHDSNQNKDVLENSNVYVASINLTNPLQSKNQCDRSQSKNRRTSTFKGKKVQASKGKHIQSLPKEDAQKIQCSPPIDHSTQIEMDMKDVKKIVPSTSTFNVQVSEQSQPSIKNQKSSLKTVTAKSLQTILSHFIHDRNMFWNFGMINQNHLDCVFSLMKSNITSNDVILISNQSQLQTIFKSDKISCKLDTFNIVIEIESVWIQDYQLIADQVERLVRVAKNLNSMKIRAEDFSFETSLVSKLDMVVKYKRRSSSERRSSSVVDDNEQKESKKDKSINYNKVSDSFMKGILKGKGILKQKGCKYFSLESTPTCKIDTTNVLRYIARYCRHLKDISLYNGDNTLSEEGLLKVFTSCKELYNLCIANCTTLTNLQEFIDLETKLEYLSLWKCFNLSDSGLQNLCKSSKFIRTLILRDGMLISDEGIKSIGENCLSLKKLELEKFVKITDSGLKFVIDKCKRIKTLNIAGCELISNECIKKFRDYKIEVRK